MTPSLEDYLESVYLLVEEKKVARVKDVAEKLGVKKPSVINAVRELESRGFLNHEKYGYIDLTDTGGVKAREILKKHVMLKRFLLELIGVSEENAEKDACRIEHYLSDETLEKLEKFMVDAIGGTGKVLAGGAI
jgi:DtxR family Mn-dependent transcriptional regulator